MSARTDASPLVTVVVPAFNAAETIHRTLDSLVVQTLRDFEVVVVDDASQDATIAIAQSYTDRLPSLRIVPRETNSGGVGAPRNDGIRAALGTYVMFLDADDELPAKACEILVNSARATGADITAGRTVRVNEGRGQTTTWQGALYGADRHVGEIGDWPELINDPIAAGKAYRRAFLEEGRIRFPEGVFYEDTFFSAKTYALARGISVLAETVYRWLWADPQDGAGSITNRRGEIRSITDRISVHRQTDAFLAEIGARDVKIYKDLRFISHDVRLYMKELRQGDEEFRAAFLELVAGYLAEIDPEAYTLCGPTDRVRSFYLRHGLADAAVTVADFEQRRSVLSTDLVRRDGRTYWSRTGLDLPDAADFLDVTELGLDEESFENSRLFNKVTSIALSGGVLTVTGALRNQFGAIRPDDPLELSLHVRVRETGERAIVDATDVRVGDEWVSYTASIPLADRLVPFTPVLGTVNALMPVVWKGKKHTTALSVHGVDLGPVNEAVGAAGLDAYATGSGNLALRPAAAAGDGPQRRIPEQSAWSWWEGRPLPAAVPAPASFAVAAVVLCAGHGDAVRGALHSLACQPAFPRTRVLLAADEAEGQRPLVLEEFAERYANVSVVAAGTAVTADLAGAPYVTFLDGSGVLAEGGLDRLLGATAGAGAGGAAGVKGAAGAGGVAGTADAVLGDTVSEPGILRGAERMRDELFGSGDRTFAGVAEAPGLLFTGTPSGLLLRTGLLPGAGLPTGPGQERERLRALVSALLRAGKLVLVDAFVYTGTASTQARRPDQSFGDRLAAARSVLALGLDVLGDPATADGASRALAHRFVAGAFDEHLTALPKMLGRVDLAGIYPDVRKLYRDVPDEVILETHDPRSSLRMHHAVKAGNESLFVAPADTLDYDAELRVDGGVLHRTVVGDTERSTLLQVGSRTALAESARPVDGGLRVEGFLTLNRVDLDQTLTNTLQLVLTTSRGAEHVVPVQQVYRRDRWHIRKQHDLNSGWRADLDQAVLSRLGGGSFSLAVRIVAEGGSVDIPVMARPVFHRFKGVERVGRFRYEVLVGEGRLVGLRIDARRSARALGRRAGRFGREALAVAARRPGWWLRLLYWLTRPVLGRRDIWIVGERHDTAQDNGYHFFRWARENRPKRHVYYVIDKSAADRAKVAPFGNVIDAGSLKHKLYLLHASRVVSPYDLEAYLAPPGVTKVNFLRWFGDLLRYRRVFLQHGVTYNDVSQSAHRQSTSVDLFVAASEREAEYITAEMGYLPGEVRALGFPRFDRLQPIETPTRSILLMPTWRRDIVVPSYNRSLRPKVQFAASEYFRFYSRLLEDERLRAALERSGVRLEFFPHYEIRPHLRHFQVEHPNIVVADQTQRGVQEAMRECSLLVTDYSSVFFDVAYMGKPIVYVPFDEDDFYGRHYRRGYFDLTRDGFGPVCRTVDGAVDEIIALIDRGFTMESTYSGRVDDFFGTRDTENSARVFQAVDDLRTGA